MPRNDGAPLPEISIKPPDWEKDPRRVKIENTTILLDIVLADLYTDLQSRPFFTYDEVDFHWMRSLVKRMRELLGEEEPKPTNVFRLDEQNRDAYNEERRRMKDASGEADKHLDEGSV